MKGLFHKLFQSIILASVFVILSGCTFDKSITAGAGIKKPAEISAWLAYWDLTAGEKDLAKIEGNLTSLSYFAAYFDPQNHAFIPQELIAKRNELKKKKVRYDSYLTIVNDKQNADGSVVMKDTETLSTLFASDAAMDKHIDEIIALTLQGGYSGIEIDYEKVWKDESLGQAFLRFASKLYAKTLDRQLKLRIVLEPSAPFSSPGFFAGPEYVVMFYNLYGLHSGPGPKADKAFLQKVLTRIQVLPGKHSIALATGGCLWGGATGEKRFLTEIEAKMLAIEHDAQPERDAASQCLVFTFRDKGVSYQVWYADIITLQYWTTIAVEQGEPNISIWRLGGNININRIK